VRAKAEDHSHVERMMPFNFISSDGRRKASLQDATSPHSKGVLGGQHPWQVGFQMSERDLVWSQEFSEKLVKVHSIIKASLLQTHSHVECKGKVSVFHVVIIDAARIHISQSLVCLNETRG
jgi:hypothetical protein